MRHRHLEVGPGAPVEEWPSAAIVDLLERGDLDDWRPLAEAIAREPAGELAGRVARLVDAYPAYGTSPLWRAWIERRRARGPGEAEPAEPIGLPELRHRLGLRQVDVAHRAGMTQSDVSKLERRSDVRLGTLARYVDALGGSLRILCRVGGRWLALRLPRSTLGRPRGDRPTNAGRTRSSPRADTPSKNRRGETEPRRGAVEK